MFCPGILTPSAPDTALLTTGGADIVLARFGIRNEIHPGHSRQLFLPFFVCRFVIDNFVERLKRQQHPVIAGKADFGHGRANLQHFLLCRSVLTKIDRSLAPVNYKTLFHISK